MERNEIIDQIGKIREKNNDPWIELEKINKPNQSFWEALKRIRKGDNILKMEMIKEAFHRNPEKAKEIFRQITEYDRQINELSKELCKWQNVQNVKKK